MNRILQVMLAVGLAVAFAACSDDDPPPVGGCDEAKVCGDACCTADQECIGGVCQVPSTGCVAGTTTCGATCCNDTTEMCVAGACQPKGQCLTGQTACGTACCDDATEMCVSDACQPKPECSPACVGETPECVDGACKCNATSCSSGRVCASNGTCQDEVVGACEIPTQLGTFNVTGEFYAESGYTAMAADLPTADVIQLQLYEGFGAFEAGFRTGTFQLAGDDLNFGTCGLCVLVFALDANGEEVGIYFPTSGTVQITELSDSSVRAVLTNMQLVEVDIDPNTYESSPTGSGCATAITNGTLAAATAAECDPLNPTPVCGAGQACYWNGTGYSCYAPGSSPLGGSCSQGADCVPGADCFNPGVCVAYCSISNPAQCAGDEVCEDIGEGDRGACFAPPCDPLAADSCGAGQGCYYNGSDFACGPAGTIAANDTCETMGQCVPGAECLSPGICRTFCDTTAANSCGGDFVCGDLGMDNLGVCIPPPCDPLASGSCPDGQGCYLGSFGFECGPVGSQGVGADCDYGYDCLPGMDCIGAWPGWFSGVCAQLCADASDCSGVASCVEFEPPVGYCDPCPTARTCGTVCCGEFEICDTTEEPTCIPEPTPENDLCDGAIALTLNTPVTGTNNAASADYGESLSAACYSQAGYNGKGPEVVYSYTPTANGSFTITVTPSSGFDPLVWVSPVCGDQAACTNAADGGGGGRVETVTVNGVAGTTYFIHVDVYSATSASRRGDFSIVIQ